jgi:hypothetical protein
MALSARNLGSIPFAGLVIASVVYATEASAATIGSVEGEVSINRGQGYSRVAPSANANVGDMVMAGPNSSAQITYPDGCTIAVKSGGVHTVGEKSPCASGEQTSTQTGLTNGQMVLGGAALAGTGAGIYFLTKKDKASSP